MNIDVTNLESAVQGAQSSLRDALVACDIWDVNTGLSIAAVNSQPAAVALFNDLTRRIQATLAESGWPGLGSRYWLQLKNNHIVVVLRLSPEICAGMLVDGAKTNLGVLLNVAIPRMFREAVPAA